MIRIVLVMFLISQITFSQTKFEQGMQQALKFEQDGKIDEAGNLYERIGNAASTNWLPYYNLALLKTRTTFKIKDNTLIETQLDLATNFVNSADAISPDNSEIYVLKALINVAKIVSNPMVNGRNLSGETIYLYKKAIALNPDNPRAHSGLANFQMGSARFFKQDLTPYCKKLQESLAMYDIFKPESKFHPIWGKERALEALKDCNRTVGQTH